MRTIQEDTMHQGREVPVALHHGCGTCRNRGPACDDCVFRSVIAREGGSGRGFDESERAAIAALAGQGLVPPLRLAPPLAA